MSGTHARSIARNRLRWTVLVSATATLAICSCTLSRAEERRETCEQPGETLAIYDCQTGLVLWSRGTSEPMPPMVLSDREICRLVLDPRQPSQDAGQCL